MSDLPDDITAGAMATPSYHYDLDEVRRSHARLRAALPEPSEVYYSLKANPHPAIVSALHTAGCRAEVCSPGELQAALDAGVPAGKLLYTGPGKQDRAVEDAVKAGVTEFSVDSPHGLDQLDETARRLDAPVRAVLRVNDSTPAPGQGLTMTGVASPFGADAEWILAEPERFRSRPMARLVGFHLYMGTNVPDEDALMAQFTQSAATARTLADVLGIEVELLDLGGGFAAPYAREGELASYPTLAGRLAELLDDGFPGWREGRPAVAFESGRHLVATCGTLFTRVLDVKRSHGRRVLVLESGINHLGGMSGLRRLPQIAPAVLHGEPGGEPLADAMVTGPLCTPLDTWARAAEVADVRPGDVVRVPNVGAYGLSASLLAFLGHPAPVEVVVDGGRIVQESRLTLQRQPSN
ncbi:type III PLP-dependent enzyme [Streptomyces sp. NPDC004327]|uniref:type III PLP-dependent enzyme n=1 Tax=Streptomyces sp. NPDC004327 TaxID=3364699 RepID=UPI0036B853EF